MQYSLRILEYISLLKAYSLIKLLIKLIIITLMCFCYYFAIIFTPNSEFEKEITENRKLHKKPLQVDKTGLKRAEKIWKFTYYVLTYENIASLCCLEVVKKSESDIITAYVERILLILNTLKDNLFTYEFVFALTVILRWTEVTKRWYFPEVFFTQEK